MAKNKKKTPVKVKEQQKDYADEILKEVKHTEYIRRWEV